MSGQRDLIIGTPTANRRRPEIEDLIGFFINMLAVRIDLSGSPTVSQMLERVRKQTLAAQQNQDIPFEHVVELVHPVRSLSHNPLFQVTFAWQNAPEGALTLPGLELLPLWPSSRVMTELDMTLLLRESGNGIVGGIRHLGTRMVRLLIQDRQLLDFRQGKPEFLSLLNED